MSCVCSNVPENNIFNPWFLATADASSAWAGELALASGVVDHGHPDGCRRDRIPFAHFPVNLKIFLLF